MKYKVAERFKSIQGEGVYAGTPMAFIRFVGCSVGKRICQHCDTDFDEMMPWRGGGEFTAKELCEWAEPYEHICLTGGEPLDQPLRSLFEQVADYTERARPMVHVETSGTRSWVGYDGVKFWICVSPKPGFSEALIERADEVKVIVPGLGNITPSLRDQLATRAPGAWADLIEPENLRWPTLEDALRWAAQGKTVFLQPRNAKHDIDKVNLTYVLDLIRDHPNLRLSTQLHKILKVQ